MPPHAHTPYLIVSMALACTLAACGSEDTCQTATAAICEQACACTDGPTCQVQDGTTTITFDDQSDCVSFYSGFVCPEIDQLGIDPDWGACRAAIDEAACVTLADDSQAIRSPAECGSEEPDPGDAGTGDAASGDAGIIDAGPTDAIMPDAAPGSATVIDQGQNNWALMEGPVLPGTAPDIGSNRKQIPVAETDPTNQLTLGTFYVLRKGTGSSRLVVSVRNTGAPVCFVQADILLYQADDTFLDSDTAYVSGSVGDTGNIRTDTCLQSNEVGYINHFIQSPFDSIARAELTLSVQSLDTLPQGEALPFNYGYEFDTLMVVYVRNNSETAVSVRFSDWILLDDNGAPLDAGVLSFYDNPVRIDPFVEHYLTAQSTLELLTSGRKLWAQVEFQDIASAQQLETQTAPSTPPWEQTGREPTPSERARWYQMMRDQHREHAHSLFLRSRDTSARQ